METWKKQLEVEGQQRKEGQWRHGRSSLRLKVNNEKKANGDMEEAA